MSWGPIRADEALALVTATADGDEPRTGRDEKANTFLRILDGLGF